ncbi:hypothetical protein [Taibaiella koreensis]|uniref:hypothetical protein n=1 Tax=Taibaiella koreensis TaxID=1268548 RepID=UPI000E599F14|nr:hypothetical protein [Taibaiella koreensis]
MERFTNEYSRLVNEVKRELSAFSPDDGVRVVLRYLEMPWIRGDWVSFVVLADEKGLYRIIHRRWDREYDRQRSLMGIFNLDRIAIHEDNLHLSPVQRLSLDKLIVAIALPDVLQNAMVIDGIDSVLFIHNNDKQHEYWWNTGPDKIACFAPVIAYLKTLFSFT